jgi:hypothetical protein
VQASEWLLTVAVVVVPLIIAVVVTLWSLKQVRYQPKKWQPPREGGREGERAPVSSASAEAEER